MRIFSKRSRLSRYRKVTTHEYTSNDNDSYKKRTNLHIVDFFMIDSLTDKENIEHLMHVMKQKEDDIGNSYEINKDFQTFERNR